MLKINLALLWIVATLPSFAQHTEVIVKRTDVVQVSNGDESPNVSQVNSVTIYYISCNNVIYCGPSTDASSSNTYTFESATNPLWTMPSLLSSGAFTPAAMPTSIDASVSSSMPIWLSTSIPALETDTGQVLSSLGQSPFTGDQPILTTNGTSLFTASQPSLVAYLGSQTLSSALGTEPIWLTKGSDATSLASVIGGSLPALSSDGTIDVGRLVLASSSTPMLTSTLGGSTPLTGTVLPASLMIGNSGSLIGGLSAATGADGESLSQQIESIKESGARVVSWSVLYENGPVKSN